ncbi:putative ribonuclease H-like domain-containing protein [Tanacetum coccineum]|uniref:Ribonuclease H-like domain-containing protein n=1 Tax=Tanacetum coccineum TaxID=301880 RepID=A0ABQ5B4L5_9ASTR
MTGNNDHLDDFEEFKGGSVTFGGSKGYITGKGRIKVGNLEFDSVSFVKELGHFNLFSISQICDKHHKFLFTEIECLVVTPDFKMPDENPITSKGPIDNTICKVYDYEDTWNKGIKQEYSNARTPQQNGVAERMNMTLIEAARTMLADSLLPTTFWAEAVNTACYIFNRVRVTKPQNKTPYELLFGHKPMISYIRPFGCHVTILDTLSVLGKFDGKSDKGHLVGYSLNNKAYRVYNLVTKRVEVNLHVNFLEEKPNVKGVGYRWMFDIDYLTDSMNYIPVSLENQAKPHAGTSAVTNHAGTSEVTNSAGTPNTNASEEEDKTEELIIVPTAVQHTAAKVGTRKPSTNSKKEECLTELQNLKSQEKEASPNGISEDAPDILAFRKELDAIAQKHLGAALENKTTNDSDMPELEIFNRPKQGIFDAASYDEEGVVTDFNNLPTEVAVSPIPTLRIHNIHPKNQILRDPKKNQRRFQKLLLMRARLRLCKRSYCSSSFKRQEEGIDYDEVFAPLAKIEAIRLFLAFASFMGFIVYQMDVKSAFMNGTIDEEVYVSQPPGFVDPGHPKKVLMEVVKALYGLHQVPRAWYATMSTFLEEHGYRRGSIDKTLFIKKNKKDIMQSSRLQSQTNQTVLLSLKDKYVADMLKKFDLGKPNLGLWYPRDSPFALEAFSDSDYAGANLDRKSTTGGCQFLGRRLISWQCKKQTIVATSTTEAEYVAAANCCGQILWIQNQLLDYGFNFMNTKIHIDNESTICIVKKSNVSLEDKAHRDKASFH